MPHAGLDPGASCNALAVAVVDQTLAGIWVPIYLAEIFGTPEIPLDVRNVLVPHARACAALGCSSWLTDAFGLHDAKHAGWDAGLHTEAEGGDRWERWRDVRAVGARGAWSFAPHRRLPRPMHPLLAVLAEQLGTVIERFKAGQRTIEIPTIGASHGDLASAYARALHHAGAGNVQGVALERFRVGGDAYASETPILRVSDF